MEFLFELFKNLPRQGPGSAASTLKALETIDLPANPRVLDVGCGTGNQTLTLAKHLNGYITAVDVHQPYLDILYHLAYHLKAESKVETVNRSMADLDFPENTFDLIWSEGAIYIMGFEDGLANLRRFLKPGRYIAVTELSWLKNAAPDKVKIFWQQEYPQIKTVGENIENIQNLDYHLIDNFSLPSSDWWNEFYKHLEKRIEYFKEKYAAGSEEYDLLEGTSEEIEIWKEFKEYYGYEFYIMQKP